MGYRHDRQDLLDAAVDAALDDGLGALTFGRLAKRTGVSDRTIVYYFPTKQHLVTDVLAAVGTRLQGILDAALTEPATDHVDLLRSVWPLVAVPEHDAVFALFFEASGLAAAGHEPYRTLAPLIIEAWIDWASDRLRPSSGGDTRAGAAAAVALLDGALLLRQLAGPAAADLAVDLLSKS